MVMPKDVVTWLLDSDPSIRWQVMRDLQHAPVEQVDAERARVGTEGWGAQLLSARDPDGQWVGGACFPGRGGPWPEGTQPWTSTLPALMDLYVMGLDPKSDVAQGMTALVAENCRWEHAGQPFFDGEVEACINGRTVALGAYFGADVSGLVERLLGERMADGGWNCELENGSVRSSFDSTINVLEGLLEYERATGGSDEVRTARRGGEDYLLERSLLRSRTTGEIPVEGWTQLSFPPRWHYDVLRGLEHFRAADRRDPRLEEAVELVRSKQQPDGRWLLEQVHPGDVHVDVGETEGRPSRWNTLRAARILDWWDAP